jgi:P-type Ca2+ transporter type 2C
MTVVSLVVLEKTDKGFPNVREHTVEGVSYSPIGSVVGIKCNEEVVTRPLGALADVAAVSALCNDARIIGNDNIVDDVTDETLSRTKKNAKSHNSSDKKVYERVGEPTEAALCVLAEKIGGMSSFFEQGHVDRQGLHFDVPPSVLASSNVNKWRELHPRTATLEFSRDRKSMSVLCDYQNNLKSRQGGNRLLVKGAPNLLMERCTHVKYRDGTIVKLTGQLRRDIESKVSLLAKRPLRCLALAVKDYSNLENSLKRFTPKDERDIARHPLLSDSSKYTSVESGLTLVGIVGIKDPARPGVADSINLCSKAGIRVMMITGDAKDTAVAIAREVNIFPPKSDTNENDVKAFEGREFFLKSYDQQLEILKNDNIVFCRAEPADKQKLVKMLQSLNEVTCMTGDGVVSRESFCVEAIFPYLFFKADINDVFLRMTHLRFSKRRSV